MAARKDEGGKLRKGWQVRITRDLVLFIGGLVGTANELFIEPEVRPEVLVFLAGMLGLPAFLRRDEEERREKRDST